LQNENNFQILPNPQVTKISFSTDGQDFWMFEQSSGNLRRYSNIPLTESAGATVNSKKSDFEYNVPSPVPSVRSIVGLGNGSAALEFENYIRVVGEDIRLTVALDPLRRHLHARNLGGLVAGSLYYVHRLRGGALLSLTFERAGTFIFRRSRREKRWVVHSWFGRPDVGPTGAIGVRHIIESPVGRPVEDRIFARPSTPVRAGFPRIGAPRPIVGQAPLAGGWLDNETIWRVDVAGNFEALRQYDGQYKLLARFKIETWVPDSSAIFRKRDLVSEVIIEYDSGHVNRIDLDAFRQLLSAGEQDH
ncbi:MAG TPA: hypothetical protein PLH57_02300, partial [Oligoflexia bacterium]|nr:hypothetical protein [Oligoflexia bacterium]